jgi:hypothetical protein
VNSGSAALETLRSENAASDDTNETAAAAVRDAAPRTCATFRGASAEMAGVVAQPEMGTVRTQD